MQPDTPTVAYGHNVTYTCSLQNRPGKQLNPRHANKLDPFLARRSPLTGSRQCIYDPRPDGVEYWLAGNEIDCPLVDCGPPPALSGALVARTMAAIFSSGAFYEGEDNNYKVGSAYLFSCRPPYSLVGKSSYDDRIVRCNVDGTWDLGDLRCEGILDTEIACMHEWFKDRYASIPERPMTVRPTSIPSKKARLAASRVIAPVTNRTRPITSTARSERCAYSAKMSASPADSSLTALSRTTQVCIPQ